tara:strand:+ start:23206 stop:23595 length:390 start_codon:yes stop_codon:yes gene_type:complete
MGATNYLIDTNAVIDYLGGRLPGKGKVFMDGVINKGPQISFITQIELLCFQTSDKNLSLLSEFVNDSIVYGVQEKITEITIDLRRMYSIKIPDALIAATALNNKLTLITRNVKDFEKIPDLSLLNPYEL